MNKKNVLIILIGFISGLVNGLLGSGGGVVLVPSLVFISNIKDHKAHSTAISIILPLTIISSIIYLKQGIPPIGIAMYTTMGAMLGSFFGSKLLNKVPISVLRKVFGFVMIISAIRMVF